jgi:hypothetical protein
MDGLDEKLEKARSHAAGYGNKMALKATADDYLKGVYAMLYADAPDGTVAEKDAWIRRQPKHKDAIIEKQNRYAAADTARIYMDILKAEVEKYRSDLSYAKHMDGLHT